MTKKTIKDMLIDDNYGHLVFVPKGSTTSHQTAVGLDEKYNFLQWNDDIKVFYKHDLSLVVDIKNSVFLHDFTFYGINIKAECVK